ncbi:hypothetical protein SAMN04489761_2218 [Tenacibaculum sp. MAR_2009_124]|uniref:hypothetical protein n=1 Tax=Tenacibaculum sp. MAR_2009_124 TaxID=1250059 RepID=UPI0008971FC2|nr:hypothetical protein [Tenacibaculum sp. MAR_2009_124]SEC00189.1 hypothetical protein SAMN04489761_2218 [Tenacibaculum sp. MAR_2009_124]
MIRKFLLCFFLCYTWLSIAQIEANSIMAIPVLSNTEMNSVVTPNQGSFIYNSTDNKLYKYTGTEWLPIGLGSFINEDLKLIRGNVNANGTIAQGTGFTVTKLTSSRYQIDFSNPFTGVPSVTFTPGDLNALNNYEDNVVNIIFLSNSRVVVVTHDNEGENVREDSWFSFIAVGPR